MKPAPRAVYNRATPFTAIVRTAGSILQVVVRAWDEQEAERMVRRLYCGAIDLILVGGPDFPANVATLKAQIAASRAQLVIDQANAKARRQAARAAALAAKPPKVKVSVPVVLPACLRALDRSSDELGRGMRSLMAGR
jgi:hypothetical protein